MRPQTLSFGEYVKFVIDREYMDEAKTRYGKVIGHGLNGSSVKGDSDYKIITLITPDGNLYRKGISSLQHIDILDYEQIKKLENKTDKPYRDLFKEGYTKEDALKEVGKEFRPVNLNTTNPNNLRGNYSRVGVDVFSDALIKVANKLSGDDKKYKLRTLEVINEFPMFNGSDETVEIKRYMILLSKKRYPKIYRHLKFKEAFTPEFQDQTSFRKHKVQINPDDILLYFSHPGEFYPYSNHVDYALPSTLHIVKKDRINGCWKFSPSEIFTRNNHKEYTTNNQQHTFVQDFINDVIKYKIKYRRPNLDKDDYDIIVKGFLAKLAQKENSQPSM